MMILKAKEDCRLREIFPQYTDLKKKLTLIPLCHEIPNTMAIKNKAGLYMTLLMDSEQDDATSILLPANTAEEYQEDRDQLFKDAEENLLKQKIMLETKKVRVGNTRVDGMAIVFSPDNEYGASLPFITGVGDRISKGTGWDTFFVVPSGLSCCIIFPEIDLRTGRKHPATYKMVSNMVKMISNHIQFPDYIPANSVFHYNGTEIEGGQIYA